MKISRPLGGGITCFGSERRYSLVIVIYGPSFLCRAHCKCRNERREAVQWLGKMSRNSWHSNHIKGTKNLGSQGGMDLEMFGTRPKPDVRQ